MVRISSLLIPEISLNEIRIPDPSTLVSALDLFTSIGSMVRPSCLASSRINRFGYIPGSCVSKPAINAAG